jgi:hypothetical protein
MFETEFLGSDENNVSRTWGLQNDITPGVSTLDVRLKCLLGRSKEE